MKVLLIGAGAMGGAILRGCLDHQVWKKEDVLIKGRTAESSRRVCGGVWRFLVGRWS